MFAHQMTSSRMSSGPDELPVLAALAVPGQQADDPERVHDVPRPGAPDAEPLAPHAARPDEPREHVEERAEVHHRQPREDHAVHVRRPDAAEREPRDAAERLRRDELGGEDEPEEVDDGQPDDRGQEPVLGRLVGERGAAVPPAPSAARAPPPRSRPWRSAIGATLCRSRQALSRRDDEIVIYLSFAGHPRYGRSRKRCRSWSSRMNPESSRSWLAAWRRRVSRGCGRRQARWA